MQARSETYKGHEIVMLGAPERARETADSMEQPPAVELLIDGEPVSYGQLPHGLCYLHENVYDWDKDLLELARRLIDHRADAADARRGHGTRAGK